MLFQTHLLTKLSEKRDEFISFDNIMRSGAEADSLIGFRRFKEEVRALRRFIERHQGWEERNEPMPL